MVSRFRLSGHPILRAVFFAISYERNPFLTPLPPCSSCTHFSFETHGAPFISFPVRLFFFKYPLYFFYPLICFLDSVQLITLESSFLFPSGPYGNLFNRRPDFFCPNPIMSLLWLTSLPIVGLHPQQPQKVQTLTTCARVFDPPRLPRLTLPLLGPCPILR